MVNKYPTAELVGLVVEQDASGQYVRKQPSIPHSWRIGKHTRGSLGQPGQLFLTENGLFAQLVEVRPLAFKDRHDFQPIARFLSVQLPL